MQQDKNYINLFLIKKGCNTVLFCYICYMDKYKYFDKAYDKAEQDRVFHCGQYDEKDMASWGFNLGIKFAEENLKTVEYFMGESLDKDEVSEWFYESFSDEVIELNENYSIDKEKYLKETSEPFVSDMFNQKWKESIFNDEWKNFIAGEIAANFPDKVVDIDIYDVVDYLAYSISTDIFENN